MYLYFTGNTPYFIKCNDAYLGKAFDIPLKCNFSDDTTPFIQFFPLSGKGQTFSFIADKEFFENPPPQVIITDLNGGYLIFFNCFIQNKPFSIIKQEKISYALITLFTDNTNKLSIETQSDFYSENIQLEYSDVKVQNIFDQNHLAIVLNLLNNQKSVKIFDLQNKISCIFENTFNEIEIGEFLKTTKNCSDIAKHIISEKWELNNDKVILTEKNISCDFDKEKIIFDIYPFAFLEEILIGGDFSFYLSEDLISFSDRLPDYFGEFIGVIPPPLFINSTDNCVGLVYKQKENKYYVKYFCFTLKNGKIDNINILE